VIKAVIAIGQAPVVFRMKEDFPDRFDELRLLLQELLLVERAYSSLGGIVGYHLNFLRLLKPSGKTERATFLQPRGQEQGDPKAKAALYSIEKLDELAEIWVVGGAADRFGLVDEETKKPLPLAGLQFLGRGLLAGMVRDVEAREYLYYKLFGKRITLPICLMTSHEKDNDAFIRRLCEASSWFGRPKESFLIFTQPSVPVITEEGNWVMQEPLKMMKKPGGHGVVWELARSSGTLKALLAKGIKAAIVRQVNNPAAGVDRGLSTLAGFGLSQNKAMGFLSCERRVGASEGMNVLVEKAHSNGFSYTLTNVEYTDFVKRGIQDLPKKPGSPYSCFPANTNVLYVDLAQAEELAIKNPLPGLLINLKHKQNYIDEMGSTHLLPAGRLETLMQNLADGLELKVQDKKEDVSLEHPAFITFNERKKTISAIKKPYTGESPLDTPEGCYEDLLELSEDLEAVVGKGPMPRTEITKKIWDYIKKNKLQDPKNKRNIVPDAKQSVWRKKPPSTCLK